MSKTLKDLSASLDRIFNVISRICEYIGIVGLCGIMLMLIAQAVLQWLSVSILWSDELVSVMNVWLVFSAASVVSYENKHVQVDFFTSRMPRTVRLLLDIAISLLCLFSCWHIFAGGIGFLRKTGNITTNILRLPMIAIYLAPMIAIAFMGLMYIRRCFDKVVRLLGKEEACE